MGKPKNQAYQQFVELFNDANQELGLKQFVVPYLMSSHPGSTLTEAVELAEFCRDMGFNPEQVQDFYPTPSTISTCIYYTGVDPRTMKPVYCPRSPHEKALQRALIQYRDPKNRDLVTEALRKAGRQDLIGYGPKCLVRPKGDSKSGGRPNGAGKHGGQGGSAGRPGKPGKPGGSGGSGSANGKGGRGNAAAPGRKGSKSDWLRANPRNGKAQRGQQHGRSGKGMGPNKASGHKGGISRQGSKR